MKSRFLLFIGVIQFVWLSSCVEAYWPEIDKYENKLVVDGEITNEPGPYIIRLSRSSPVTEPEFIPFTSCEVIISDNLGNSEILSEEEPGIYITSENGIQGEIGRSYKVTIHTPADITYESSFEELKKPGLIDSVYAKVESKQQQDSHYDMEGYQFYLDTKLAEQDTNYYLWNLDATYHYNADFLIRWYFDGKLNWMVNTDTLYNCWSSYAVDDIFLYGTAGLSEPAIKGYPLHYVNTETRQLSVRYSLLVKQFTISKEAYAFWTGVKEHNSDEESLYSKQPYQIRGNVVNTMDPTEPVLGYFHVAGISEKRIFVDRPLAPVKFHYSICDLDDADFEAYSQMGMADPVSYPLFAVESPGGRRATPPRGCTDCTQKGGTATKPDFWVD